MIRKRLTEAEWVASRSSYLMLPSIRRTIVNDPRKGRLFAVACCYRIWHLLADQGSRAAVETSELYADGRATWDQLRAAHDEAGSAHADAFQSKGKVGASAEWAAQFSASPTAWFAATRASMFAYLAAGDRGLKEAPEQAVQARLLRCIFGPLPFRPVSLDASCVTPPITELAQSIYDERTFERMPKLADTLEQAGCTNVDVLNHCRCTGPHVRGCWVLDLLLAKRKLVPV